jgi:DNA-binding IclR family transcriptional regulator
VASQLNNSVIRGFAILDLFTPDRPQLSSGEVASALGMNNVTAHRFLKSLEAAGALIAVRKGQYRLGYRLLDLAARAGDEHNLVSRLQPVLNELAEKVNESVMATRFDGRWTTCVATAYSSRAVAFNARIGARFESHATANGKVWLANLDPAAFKRYLDSTPLERISENTLADRDALVRDIEATRERGYAINEQEREIDLHAVAVPIKSREGVMVAGVSIFGPSARFDQKASEAALPLLFEAAKSAQDVLYG